MCTSLPDPHYYFYCIPEHLYFSQILVLNYTILVFSAKENQYVYLPEMKNIKRKSMFFMTLVAYPFQQSDSHSNREWLNNIPTDIDL